MTCCAEKNKGCHCLSHSIVYVESPNLVARFQVERNMSWERETSSTALATATALLVSADPSLRGSALRRVFRRRSFLRLCLVAEVSQWLGHDFIVFRGSKRNVFRMRSRRSFLGLCLVAAVSQWLGHDFIVFRGSKSNTFSHCF